MRFKSLITAFLLAVSAPLPLMAGDEMVFFSDEDPKMSAAIHEAQSTLNDALSLVPQQNGTYNEALTLKVSMKRSDGQGDEIIWVGAIRAISADRFAGKLENAPNHLDGKKLGSRVKFGTAQIADWSIYANGVLWGNYTTRVMLPHLSREDADYLKGILSTRPFPK